MRINLNKIYRLFAVTFLFLAVSSASAADPTVSFEKTPLFSDTNFAPGNSVTRWIKITNNTDKSHMSVIKAANVSSVKNMGAKLKIEISENGSTIYSGKFSDFSGLSKVELGNISPGAQKKFDFTATFLSDSGDAYQGGSLSFDIKAGLEDVEIVSDTSRGGGGLITPNREYDRKPNKETDVVSKTDEAKADIIAQEDMPSFRQETLIPPNPPLSNKIEGVTKIKILPGPANKNGTSTRARISENYSLQMANIYEAFVPALVKVSRLITILLITLFLLVYRRRKNNK